MRQLLVVPVTVVILAASPAAGAVIWTIGTNNDSHSEMEQEGGSRNDANFYVDGGVDFSSVAGFGGVGADRTGSPAEPLIDTTSPDASTEGFPRALTVSTTNLNLFFDLAADDASRDTRYRVDFEFHTGAGGTVHDLELFWNATDSPPTNEVGQVADLGFPSTVRLEFTAAEAGAVAGPNVLSLQRTGGSDTGWLTFDHLRLSTVDPREVFTIGFDDNTPSEFDAEHQADQKFYWEPGDYSGTVGLNGAGASVTEAENYRVPGGDSSEGFPRALQGTGTNSKTDIFFQLTEEEVGFGKFRFQTDLINLGSGSTHDLEFLLNGNLIHSLSGVTGSTAVDIDLALPPDLLNVGPNVFSIQRTGGGDQSPWIQFDYLALTSVVPEPSTFVLAGLGLLGLGLAGWRRARRRVTQV